MRSSWCVSNVSKQTHPHSRHKQLSPHQRAQMRQEHRKGRVAHMWANSRSAALTLDYWWVFFFSPYQSSDDMKKKPLWSQTLFPHPQQLFGPCESSPLRSATSRHDNEQVQRQLTDDSHAGVGRPELVGGDARVVPVALLCHVGHCEDRSGADAVDVDSLTLDNPVNRHNDNRLSPSPPTLVQTRHRRSGRSQGQRKRLSPAAETERHFISLFSRWFYSLV